MPGSSSPSLAVDFGASGFWAGTAPAANMTAAAAIQEQKRIARFSETWGRAAADAAALLNRVKETGPRVKGASLRASQFVSAPGDFRVIRQSPGLSCHTPS